MKKFDFVIYLSTPWNIYHRKPYILEKAKHIKPHNGKILLIEPQISPFHALLLHPKRLIKYLFSKKVIKVSENIYNAVPFAPFHFYFGGRLKILGSINRFFLNKQLRYWLKNLDFKNKRALWIFRPECLQYTRTADENLLIYDYYDDHLIDINNNKIKNNDKRERELLQQCDYVFCTSTKLLNQAKKYNSNSHLIDNAAPIDVFLKTNEPTIKIDKSIVRLNRPIIGYHGNVRNWIDFDLVEYLLINTKYTFVFAGAVNKNAKKYVDKLNKYRNFVSTGRVEYEDFPAILKGFDVEFIPFKMSVFNESVVPYKLFESFATGKPVVSAALPDIKNRWEQWCHVYNDREEALEMLNEALSENKKQYPTDNPKMLKKLSWEDRVDDLFKFLSY
jgi:glycosyltransferase involved in cell wall biosynthesis